MVDDGDVTVDDVTFLYYYQYLFISSGQDLAVYMPCLTISI